MIVFGKYIAIDRIARLISFSIWNWQRSERLNRFSNGNPHGSKISEIRFINEDDQALLMTGSSDGVVKLFRDYESAKNVEMVSSFRGLTDLVPSTKNAGLVFDWQQGQGKLLVAGDVKVIRIWNAATEICTTVCMNPHDRSHHTDKARKYLLDRAHASPL